MKKLFWIIVAVVATLIIVVNVSGPSESTADYPKNPEATTAVATTPVSVKPVYEPEAPKDPGEVYFNCLKADDVELMGVSYEDAKNYIPDALKRAVITGRKLYNEYIKTRASGLSHTAIVSSLTDPKTILCAIEAWGSN